MSTFTWHPVSSRARPQDAQYLNTTANLVNEDWEVLDPTPDVHAMFSRFDDRFFNSKLRCVELEWSNRMYSCAGICYSRRNTLGSAITIRLSEPLLKLRPRKDLVETLLHEMIHAFSFIKGVREGNGGHGPFFHKMMNEINKVAGTNISVYHTFHDEVEVYRKHVWKCNGICQHRKPFFGLVRRVANRAPGPNDLWWKSHKEACGGYFEKVSEPEKTSKGTNSKKRVQKEDKTQPKINDAFKGISNSKPPRPNLNDARRYDPPAKNPPPRIPGSNIFGFPDIAEEPSKQPMKTTPAVPLFKGPGNNLSDRMDREIEQFKSIQEQVRASWQKRYGGIRPDSSGPAKQPRMQINLPPPPKQKPPSDITQWHVLDNDIAIKTPYVEVVDLLDSSSDEEEDEALKDHNVRLTQMANKSVDERRTLIKKELYDDKDVGDEIEMIDDEFDDTQAPPPPGSKDSLPRSVNYTAEDVVKCPICEGGVSRGYLSQHMEEGCLGIRTKVDFVKSSRALAEALAGPSSSGVRRTITPAVAAPMNQFFSCPNCGLRCSESSINEHLDECLS